MALDRLDAAEEPMNAANIGMVGGGLISPSQTAHRSGPMSEALSRLVGAIDHADQMVNQLINQTADYHKIPHSLLHEAKLANSQTENVDEPRSKARQVVDLTTARVNMLARRVEELSEILEV